MIFKQFYFEDKQLQRPLPPRSAFCLSSCHPSLRFLERVHTNYAHTLAFELVLTKRMRVICVNTL